MKKFIFTPQKFPNLHPVITASTDHLQQNLVTEIMGNIAHFVSGVLGNKKSTDVSWQQIEWMGRGCYKKLLNGGFLLGKGAGPGEGSEHMRKFLDTLNKNWAREGGKHGGCIRVQISERWPFLVQYSASSEGEVQIIDPRPEGFTIFPAAYRESGAGEVYGHLGIEIVKPLQLYRDNTPASWSGDRDAFRQVLSEQVIRVLQDQNVVAKSCQFTKDGYHDLDAGMLFRYTKTPYRISNLLEFCIHNDQESLQESIKSLVTPSTNKTLTHDDILVLQAQITKTLAKNAAIMFANGIIHGQFRRHFQNVSALGELSDFDSTVFLGISEKKESIGFDISSIATEYQKDFLALLQKGERDHQVTMVPFLKADEILFFGADGDDCTGITNMMGQIYDLFNQAMRLNDIFGRYHLPKIDCGFSSLSDERYEELIYVFTRSFKIYITSTHQRFIQERFLPHIYKFREIYMNRDLGDTSIYGWRVRPEIDYLNHNIQKNHLDDATVEVAKLFEHISR